MEECVDKYCKYEPVYSESTAKILQLEFPALQDQHYLDHAGATLYSKTQIENIYNDLQKNMYANPHSLNASAVLTSSTVDQIRYRILQHFKTTSDEYTVIFTSGATGALRLVGEYFQYNGGMFAYSQDNHTSVLGMRQYASEFKCYNPEEFSQLVSQQQELPTTKGNSLFVYPLQSNFSGVKYSPKIIKQIKSNPDWYCLLDAASGVSTCELNLTKFHPDFVCISFYKLFGYPTGLGALLVKNSSSDLLRKVYFGGGTVQVSLSQQKVHILRDNIHERFEDGTLPYLSIIALQHGFNVLENKFSLTMEMISRHVFQLGKYLHHSLQVLHHSNGKPVVCFYTSDFESLETQGGIVTFNLLRPNGEYVGYDEVMQMANVYNIHLRTGCFCNPGACQHYLHQSNENIMDNFKAGHICGDQHDLINGVPTGAVRVSFGYMSTKFNIDQLLQMISDCFIKHPIIRKLPHKSLNYQQTLNKLNQLNTKTNLPSTYQLLQIYLYPIKSCGAFSVTDTWELCKTGLKYDREFMIVNHSGVCLTQKHDPKMCQIKPIINLNTNQLVLTHPNLESVSVSLNNNNEFLRDLNICQSKVCMDRVECDDCGDKAADWLERALDRPGVRLLRQNSERIKNQNKTGGKVELSLSNQAQFLLLNMQSIKWLSSLITDPGVKFSNENLVARFRPNLVINGNQAFEELDYQFVSIGKNELESTGPCSRCQMICIDQETGLKSAEPLKTLTTNVKGRMQFGVYLKMNYCDMKSPNFLRVGDKVLIKK